MVYEKELKAAQLPGFSYVVVWKGYLKEENT